ncbi:MAG TPA: DUF3999 family protein [Terracidiphilus sp.]|nr:DUF3999 family protein [Terracidiphilus sp.]
MKISAGILLIAMAASPEIKYFHYERPMQKSSGQSCAIVDPGVFAHAAPQLADLRLYRDGAETPFVIRTDAAAETEGKSLTPLNLGVRDGETVFDASMPDGHYSDLQLVVTGQNFIATVTVSGSQTETGSAETRIGSYTIFDLTGQKLGRSTVLHLPESDFRYLHFRIKGPLTPESVTGLTVIRMLVRQPKYETVAESALITQKGRSSVLEFTVPAHVPVDRIAFTPGAKPAQFSRDVIVTVEPVDASPAADRSQSRQTVISAGDILRVHSVQNGQRIDEERLAIEAPWVDFSTPAKWTVSIENGDDAPIQLKSVQMQMLERSLCFEAEEQGSYLLYYGDAALAAPSYDYAKLFTLQANASRITAGPEVPNLTYQPRPDERPFTEKHPVLIWVALVAVIAVLGAIALKSAKPAARSPK